MISPFYRIRALDSTASTNEDVKRVAETGEAEGYVVKAKRQTGGKGRMGRTWESPEGNLYFSLLLRPRCGLQEAAFYSFVTALAVQDALHRLAPDLEVALKWPNDVLAADKKISGILLETSGATYGLIDWLVIGVGINVTSCPVGVLYPTTSLASEGFPADVDDVFEAFLNSFDRWRLTLQHDGFRPVRRAWLASAKSGMMKVRHSDRIEEGQFGGIDERGALILRLPDGVEKAIDTGDIFFDWD